jgi:16S rRNA processing protein RimM
MPELRYLAIGRIVRAHGITGEVSVTVLTDFPERFETIEWVYIGNEFEAEAYRLASYRWHKKNVLLSLDGVTNRTEAEQLRGQFVQILLEEAMPLSNGDHYLYQLIGLQVITTQGEELGIVDHILETGANDVYVIIAPDQAEVLLPAIDDVVKSVDLETGRITVELMDGLI